MLLNELWKNINLLSNSDATDDYLDPNDLNRLMADEINSFILDVIKEEKDNSPYEQKMRNYLMSSSVNAGASPANFSLPADYLLCDSAVWVPSSGPSEPIDIITLKEFYDRNNNLLKPPLSYNYIGYVEGNYIKYRPYLSSGNYTMFYIKRPATPFLDYYMTTAYVLTFLSAGQSLTAITTGEYRTGSDMSTVTGTSATVELDIPKEYHERFMYRIIDKMTLKDRDQLAMQHTTLKEQEDSAKN